MSEDLVGAMLAKVDELTTEVDNLRDTVEQQRERIDELEAETDQLRLENRQLRDRVADATETVTEYEDRLADCEDQLGSIQSYTDAVNTKTNEHKRCIEELQARELQKGAHLAAENVATSNLPLADNHLEQIAKEGGAYYRMPNSDDPLDRGGSVQLATGDLLPIQQLARMDDDMLHSATSSLPARLAVKLWQRWEDDTSHDEPWQQGSKNIRAYVAASDLRHWIRRQEASVSKDYAQKLVSRVIDAFEELAQHRVYVRKHTQRKNGLQYDERRLILPTDADIPGHPTASDGAPRTADVAG